MYRVWYWAVIQRDSDGSFIARLYDMPDVAAQGVSEKEAIEGLQVLAADHVRQLAESGHSPPQPRRTSELPTGVQTKEFSRALIPVDVARAVVRPNARSNVKT